MVLMELLFPSFEKKEARGCQKKHLKSRKIQLSELRCLTQSIFCLILGSREGSGGRFVPTMSLKSLWSMLPMISLYIFMISKGCWLPLGVHLGTMFDNEMFLFVELVLHRFRMNFGRVGDRGGSPPSLTTRDFKTRRTRKQDPHHALLPIRGGRHIENACGESPAAPPPPQMLFVWGLFAPLVFSWNVRTFPRRWQRITCILVGFAPHVPEQQKTAHTSTPELWNNHLKLIRALWKPLIFVGSEGVLDAFGEVLESFWLSASPKSAQVFQN